MYSRLAAVLAAGALAITGLATGTAHAAVAPTVTATPECGKVTITVNNPTGFTNLRLQYQADRRPVQTVTLAAGTTALPVDFREDSGRHWVRWRLWGGPERSWDNPTWTVGNLTDWHPSGFQGRWADTVRVDSDCRPNWVRADAPTVVQPECGTERGTLVIPADRGVRYEVRGRTWRAGEYKVRPGTYWVTAHARDGHRLVGDRLWRLTVDRAEACPTPTPTPTVTPTVTVSPTPTDDPTPEVVTPAAPKLTQATCDDVTASVAIPDQAGVVYKSAGGTVLEAGKSYTVKPGDTTVTAEAADGYTLAEGAKTEWVFVVSDAPTDCEATPAPTVTETSSRVIVVGDVRVPVRVDTGLGGLAR